VAPPGNQAANGENKPQPAALGGPSLLDKVRHERISYRVRPTGARDYANPFVLTPAFL